MAIEIDVAVHIETDGADMTREELVTFLVDVCRHALMCEGWEQAEVSVVVTGDEEVRLLNRQYRGIDQPTDVLSFPLDDGLQPGSDETGRKDSYDFGPLLGDIVISWDRAAAQAEEYGHSFRRELAFLTVHGLLHLLGFDHEEEDDRQVMREREEVILSRLGLLR